MSVNYQKIVIVRDSFRMLTNFIDLYGLFGFVYYRCCFILYFDKFDFPITVNLNYVRQGFHFDYLLGYDFSQAVLVIHFPVNFEILGIGNLFSC